MPSRNASGTFLHIPYKNWAVDAAKNIAKSVGGEKDAAIAPQLASDIQSQVFEKQNYDEIERWSQRIPRGFILVAGRTTPLNGVTASPELVYVQTPYFMMELGRTYKITGQWPGLASGAAGDGVAFRFRYVPKDTSQTQNLGFYTYQVAYSNTFYLGGSSFVNFVTPSKVPNNTVGMYLVQLIVHLSNGTGPASIWGADNAQGRIYVEDIGNATGSGGG